MIKAVAGKLPPFWIKSSFPDKTLGNRDIRKGVKDQCMNGVKVWEEY
jgi:hypothetical protein